MKSIKSELVAPRGPISQAILAGGILWTSQIPKDPESGEIVLPEIEDQTRQVLDNLRMTLRGAGGDLRNVTQVQIFLADGGDMAVVNQVWTSYFSEPYPNRATVVVKSLIDPKARIEITAQAYLGSD